MVWYFHFYYNHRIKMDLEETKKIIENKIEAGELTREVRRQIKSNVDQKQNVRESFKETFQPLIKTHEEVKKSIDTQQNAMIEQLQKNQKALTEGFEGNRLAITQGFDKMDEVKRWDLSQLPGLEAIEEPKKETEGIEEPEGIEIEENPAYRLSINDFNIINGIEPNYLDPEGEKIITITKKGLDAILKEGTFNQNKYILKNIDPNEGLLKVKKKPIILSYDEEEINKNLFDKDSIDTLNFLGLELPSEYKEKTLSDLNKALKKSQKILTRYKDKLKNVAKFDYFEGKRIAYPKNKNPTKTTLENIAEHNILETYNYNLNLLREYKEKTGTGIIHFNNPHQLIDRLELVAGSIFAGNNGVKQEFSQIAHLLHQLKVITKKQLNDLLKKYILNK